MTFHRIDFADFFVFFCFVLVLSVYYSIASRNFIKWKFRLACWSAAFVCLFVCWCSTAHSSTAIFTKLRKQVGTGPGKNWWMERMKSSGSTTFWRIFQHCETWHFATIFCLAKMDLDSRHGTNSHFPFNRPVNLDSVLDTTSCSTIWPLTLT